MGEALTQIVNAQLDVGLGKPVLYREVVGNVFGLASAIGGA
ncbi:MAG: nicotinamide riboside transporter PnuC, partial [Cutibacterium granulosum]|nr:nicotinamide riboside transporter PnuC [Cutibacterium granulosum]